MRYKHVFQLGDLVAYKTNGQDENPNEWIVIKTNEKEKTALIIPVSCVSDMTYLENRIFFSGIGLNAEFCKWVNFSDLDKIIIPALDSLHIRLLENFDKNLVLFEGGQERSKNVIAAYVDYDSNRHYALLEDTGGPRIVRIEYDHLPNWEAERKAMILDDLLKRYPYLFLVQKSLESIDRWQVLSSMAMPEWNLSRECTTELLSGENQDKAYTDEDDTYLIKLGHFFGKDLYWQILEKNNDKALTLCKTGIKRSAFMYEDDDDCRWESSQIRDFLNNEFFNLAFTEEEKKHITPVCTEKETEISSPIFDHIFLLSAAECRYFLPLKRDRKLTCMLNAHSWLHGHKSGENPAVSWWLRTTGYGYEHAYCINQDGETEHDIWGHLECVIRPAIVVNLSGSKIEIAKAEQTLDGEGEKTDV